MAGSAEPRKGKCASKLRGTDPPRYCLKNKVDGTTRCATHGGALPQVLHRVQVERTRKKLHRMVTAIEPGDIEANPLAAFDVELRKTIAAIRFCDERVTEVLEAEGDDALVWGTAEEVDRFSGEFPGTDTTRRAVLNAWEQKRQWEREHLVDLTKLFVAAKLDDRKTAMTDKLNDAIDSIVKAVVVGLGGDPHSAAVRKIVSDAFASVGARAPQAVES